jgi:hypothetical protein
VSRIAAPVAGTFANADAKWAGENMIASATYFGFDGVEGTGTDEALDNGYIVLADDCKIFLVDTTLGTTKELTKAQVSSTAGTAASKKTAIDGNDTVFVGEYNQYGFAKILYVVVDAT